MIDAALSATPGWELDDATGDPQNRTVQQGLNVAWVSKIPTQIARA